MLNRHLYSDDNALMPVFRIAAILVIIIIIFAGAYMVLDAGGNPFSSKTYVRTDVKVSGTWGVTEGFSAAVMDVDHRPVQERYVDQLFWDNLDPFSHDIVLQVEAIAIMEDGNERIVDMEKEGATLTATSLYVESFDLRMGPFPENAVEYELFITVYGQENKVEDTHTVSGVLGS